ncbi:MAG: ASCH domain-containing protein [Bacteroidota bacterium]
MSRFLFISLKKVYADRILSGSKTIELRKSTPKVKHGDIVVLYTTSPTKSVVGVAKVNEVYIDSPDKIWNDHELHLGIGREDFNKYFYNSKKAVGIELQDVQTLAKEITLEQIKNVFPNFTPPQTFRYFSAYTIKKLLGTLSKGKN